MFPRPSHVGEECKFRARLDGGRWAIEITNVNAVPALGFAWILQISRAGGLEADRISTRTKGFALRGALGL
jgi:hypothetical protein